VVDFATVVSSAATVASDLNVPYPELSASTTGTASAVTSYAVPMPTHAAGELLVAFVINHGSSAYTQYIDAINSSSGWVYEGPLRAAFDVQGYMSVYWKVADAASETLTVLTDSAVDYLAITQSYTNADHAYFYGKGSNASTQVPGEGSTNTPTPASIDVLQSRRYRYGVALTTLTQITGFTPPSGYTTVNDVSQDAFVALKDVTNNNVAVTTTETPGAMALGGAPQETSATAALGLAARCSRLHGPPTQVLSMAIGNGQERSRT